MSILLILLCESNTRKRLDSHHYHLFSIHIQRRKAISHDDVRA